MIDYHMRIKTSSPISQPVLLPAEDSGKFVRTLKGSLNAPELGRTLGEPLYLDNPRYLIQPRQVSWLSLRLRQTSQFSIPLNASLFEQLPTPNSRIRPISGTGQYASYVAGVTSIPAKLRPVPQGYVLVVSAATPGGGLEGPGIEYELFILSDHPVDISRMPE